MLQDRTVSEVSVQDVNAVFEGNLWILTPDAFLYYLPALMYISLARYDSVSVFASELVDALTEPSRADIVASLDRLKDLPPGFALSDPGTADLLRKQQLDWIDSGIPATIFRERFGGLPAAEGAAILAFLEAFREEHAASFPFGELEAAIDRNWASFRLPGTAESQT